MINVMECSICKKLKKANIIVLDKNICDHCEREMVNTEADDSSYEIFKDAIKDIITSANSQ